MTPSHPSIHPSIHQSINQSITQSITQSLNHSLTHSLTHIRLVRTRPRTRPTTLMRISDERHLPVLGLRIFLAPLIADTGFGCGIGLGNILAGDELKSASTLDLYGLTAGGAATDRDLGDDKLALSGGGSKRSSPWLLAGEYGESSRSTDSFWLPFCVNAVEAFLDAPSREVGATLDTTGGGVVKEA